ncbi:MAG: hypothetical protein KDD47_01110 [Acidobacteria bacterium]|nr:hypothetical protein [Acidobacteriota bacterium]
MTPKSFSPGRRRKALGVLCRDWFAEPTARLEVEVLDRRVISEHVDALVRSRRAEFCEIVEVWRRDELKARCKALELYSGGRAKVLLIDRFASSARRDLGDGQAEGIPGGACPCLSQPGES